MGDNNWNSTDGTVIQECTDLHTIFFHLKRGISKHWKHFSQIIFSKTLITFIVLSRQMGKKADEFDMDST